MDESNYESSFQSTNGKRETQFRDENRSTEPLRTDETARDDVAPQVYIIRESAQTVHSFHAGRWIVLAVVLLVIVMAVWMTSVSGTLGHLQATTTQNSQVLSNQQAHLSAISEALASIQQSLATLSAQISSFFSSVITLLSRHL